ncbi:MAG: SUMF1/EgtB/PvdO family nonheme iron enzyme, partial [Chitinivibrionales bacterium]|nr:SUMF1/EgtB/PvdO family nonheme iron enzyme [Chitinivibrionales bacterium]
TLTAIPDSGWHFKEWNGGPADGDTSAAITFPVLGNYSITALFEKDPVWYTISITTAGEGSVLAVPQADSYIEGDSVVVTANALQGWKFDHWEGDASGTNSSIIVTVDSNLAIAAHFSEMSADSFALAVTASGSGSVQPDGGRYADGADVQLIATASAGWVFDFWSGNASGTNCTTVVTMNSDKNVTANFTQTFLLSTTTQGQGGVSLDPPGGAYRSGATINVTAVPSAGWQFDHWSGALTGTDAATSISMDAEKSIVAHFVAIPAPVCTLTVSTSGNGSAIPSSGNYPKDTVLSLLATPSVGWQFDYWSGDASGTVSPLSVTLSTSKEITAHFSQIPATQYTLVVGTNGSGSVTPNGGTYDEGTVVTVAATPEQGWQFDHWEGTTDATIASFDMTMDSDKNITAHFSQIVVPEYALTSSVSGSGSITPSSGTYDEGTVLTLTATPAQGWQFVRWEGDGSGTIASLELTMDADKNVQAVFSEIPPNEYALTVSVDGNGTVTPGSGTYTEGTVVGLAAAPDPGWAFDHWSGNASGSQTAASVTMDADKSVTGHFVPLFTLSTSVTGQGSISLNPPGGTYESGAVVVATAAPQVDWFFSGWSGDATGNVASIDVTMNTNKSVAATFLHCSEGMVLIPSKLKEFTMGYSAGQVYIESPVHDVSFTYDFWMDTTEVTQERYEDVMGFNPADSLGEIGNFPVCYVNWYDAVRFCIQLSAQRGLPVCYDTGTGTGDVWTCDITLPGYRLPTSAEWEFACRANTTSQFYWGDALDGTYAWYSSNSGGSGHAVATAQPNGFNLYDMSGNVWEWCNDVFVDYSNSDPETDPTGPTPTATSNRVRRGGYWGDVGPKELRSSFRWNGRLNLHRGIGFRVARTKTE